MTSEENGAYLTYWGTGFAYENRESIDNAILNGGKMSFSDEVDRLSAVQLKSDQAVKQHAPLTYSGPIFGRTK